MSRRDYLTGLGNRLAMDETFSRISSEQALAVVFGDITGLKQVNDSIDHAAGDQLIIRSGECLRSCFPEDALFRVGGDELVAFCPGIGEGELAERLSLLRAEMDRQKVSMAIGHAYRAEGAGSPVAEQLLSVAEKRMYEDKAAYYRAHGINRRGRR